MCAVMCLENECNIWKEGAEDSVFGDELTLKLWFGTLDACVSFEEIRYELHDIQHNGINVECEILVVDSTLTSRRGFASLFLNNALRQCIGVGWLRLCSV